MPNTYLHKQNLYKTNKTRSIETVKTSAKARLTTLPVPPSGENLITCSSAHCQPFLKMSCKSDWKFLRKVDNRKWQNKTITCMAQVINKYNKKASMSWQDSAPRISGGIYGATYDFNWWLLKKPVFDCTFAVSKMWYKNIAGGFFGLVTKQ